MGIASVSLFGSVARGQASVASDIDLLVRYDPAARLSLLDVVHIENYLAGVFGRPVQLVREPIKRPRMRARRGRAAECLLAIHPSAFATSSAISSVSSATRPA